MFDRAAIAGVARQYGLHTESAYRFERGVAPELPEQALNYLVELLVTHTDAKPGVSTVHRDPDALPKVKVIRLSAAKVNQRLGTQLSASTVIDCLQRVGCQVVEEGKHVLLVTTPTHRYDLDIVDDLCEEVARIYGYHRIPATPMQLTMAPALSSATDQLSQYDIQHALSRLGYREAINYSFIAPTDQHKFYDPDAAYSCLIRLRRINHKCAGAATWPDK